MSSRRRWRKAIRTEEIQGLFALLVDLNASRTRAPHLPEVGSEQLAGVKSLITIKDHY